MYEITFTNTLPDIHHYYTLFESTGWNGDYKATPEELISTIKESWFSVSAYHKEKLVGFGRMVSDGLLHAVLFDVIVLPDYQRNGIGTEIMNRLLDKCNKHHIRDIQLFCAENKQSFYEKLGFCPRTNNAPGMEIKIKY
jgi:ribosomal protein S18 acetylase RimI-like enzyme